MLIFLEAVPIQTLKARSVMPFRTGGTVESSSGRGKGFGTLAVLECENGFLKDEVCCSNDDGQVCLSLRGLRAH